MNRRLHMEKYLWVLFLLGAVLLALSLQFRFLGFLEWFALIPAAYALFRMTENGMKLRRLWGFSFLFYFCFYLLLWRWFLNLYPLSFMDVTKGEAVLIVMSCWVGLSLLQTFLSSFVFPLFGALARTRAVQKYPLLTPFLFAALWACSEWAQNFTWAGVPWGRLALGQVPYAVIGGSVSLFGPYFLTFAVVAVSGGIAYAILHAPFRRLLSAVVAATFLVTLGAGTVGFLTASPETGRPIVVAAVQGNVGTEEKWTAESTANSYEIYERYTKEAAEAGATLVVFPETFVPATLTDKTGLGHYVKRLATTYHVTVLCGAFHMEEGEEYNGLFAVTPDGHILDTVYCKQKLVPFGEFVPWQPFFQLVLPQLVDLSMSANDLAAGHSPAVMDLPAGKVGGLICFDSIYDGIARESVRAGAELLALATNDSWFLDSVGVYMHSAQAQLRAMETGRWIVRAADTGISSLISPDGRTHEVKPPLEEGMSLGTVYFRDTRTLYSYIGNLFVYLLLLGLCSVPLASFLMKRKGQRPAA